MSEKRTSVCILGTGGISHVHATGFSKLGNVDLKVFNRTRSKAERFAEKHDVSEILNTLDEVFTRDDIDVADLRPLHEIDRVIHEPARLMILSMLYMVEACDFLFLMKQTALTRGNLSSHMGKLEAAGYVEVEKAFVNRVPRTMYRLTPSGRAAFRAYRGRMKQVLEHLPE